MPRERHDHLVEKALTHPENRSLVELWRGDAIPAETAYNIDGFELRAHPDLQDQMEEVAELGLGGYAEVGFYGRPVLVDGRGIAFAFAQGTSRLAFRFAEPPADATVNLAAHEELAGWWVVDAWGSEFPTDEYLLRLAEIMSAAFTATRRLPPN